MRIESGTNTVCSAPCSVFMHYNSDSGFPCNSENSDSSSFISAGVMPTFKSRLCDELQQSASETSNLLSTSSSHDSYSENTESKDQLRASATYDASDDIDIPQVLFFGQVVQDERSFKENPGINKISLHSGTPCRLFTQKHDNQRHDNQRELECHVDKLLHASEDRDPKVLVSDSSADYVKKDMEFTDKVINNFDKVNESIIQAESGDDKEDHKTGESHCISKKSNVNADSLLLHNACNSASVNNVSNVKSQLPSHINNNSPSTTPLYSLSQDGNPSFLNSESIVKDETLNLKIQADIVDCSLASLACGSFSENKSSCISNNEISTTIGTKGEYSYGSTKIYDINQDARLDTDCKKLFDGFSEECHANELETYDTVLDAAAKGENQHIQLQASVVDENYESDVALDDVKVCDICGDAGREDHLAICSRCSDGAEHTYCMREKLDEVPEGEWLCEECKVKETEDKNVKEGATVYGRLKSAHRNAIDQKFLSALIPKQAHKMDATRTSLNARGSVKGLQDPHVSTRRQIDCLDERKSSELSGTLTEKASPRKKSVLSYQISFKDQDARKVKMAGNESPSEVHPEKGYENISISKTYFNSSSFKGLPPRHSPRRNLSRSASFGNSKVKTVLENAPPPKQKNTREPPTNDSRKESLFKPSTKTTFKNSTLGLTNTELANKNPSLEPYCIEDLKALKEVKEQIAVEKMNFSAKGLSLVRASAAIISNHSLKFDAKLVQSDGNRNTFSEISARSGSNGHDTDDLGSNEGKRLISLSSKNIESSSCKYDANNLKGAIKEVVRRTVGADRSYGNVEIVSPRIQSLESGYKDNRIRDYTNVTGPRSSSLGSNRTIHSLRDNDTVCSSQDKLGGSAPKTSAEQKLSEVEKKGNKWREVVDAAMSRSRVLKSEKPDTLKEFPAANTDMICEGLSKHTKGAFNQKSLVVESNIGNASSKDLDDVSFKTLAIGLVPPGELSVKPSYKANGTRDTPATELSAKPKTFPGDTILLANPFNGSAVPKLECIWQGSFTVIGTGSCTKIFFGIQAHLSTCASHRVYQLAAKVPGNVLLEEVSHNSSWPLQILRTGPQEENIALFFFARDIESYDKSYKKLVDKMHRNDLALKGNIDGTELLIFTSIKLPMNSQRWNRMHFLWGMFRGKRKYYLPVIGDQNKPLSSNPNFSLAPISDVSNAQSLETNSKLNNLSDSISSNAVPGESSNDLDLRYMSELSSNIEDKTRKAMDSPIQNLLNQEPSVLQVTQEQMPSFFFGTSSGTKSETLKAVIDSPKLRLQMHKTGSFSHEKDNGFYQQEESSSDCANIKAGEPSALIHDVGVESINRSASSVPSVSQDCNKGASTTIEGKNVEKEITPAVATITDNDQKRNVLEADLLGAANRKRERSCCLEKTNEKPKSLVATVLPRDRPSWFPVEGESEQKKTCFASVAVPLGSSPKVHPLISGILCQKQPPESLCSDDMLTPLISETKERWFFPIDLNPPAVNAECPSLTHNIPSEQGKEDELESSSPDLELALGGKIKSTKPFSFTSLFHSVDGSKQDMRPGLSGDGDDASASLSLSL